MGLNRNKNTKPKELAARLEHPPQGLGFRLTPKGQALEFDWSYSGGEESETPKPLGLGNVT